MNRNFTLALASIALLTSQTVLAQTTQMSPDCSTDIVESARRLNNAEYRKNAENFEKFAAKFKKSGALKRKSVESYTIPVVFHCITDEAENGKITLEQAQNSLDNMNKDFAGLNYNWDGVDADFKDLRATLDITFCLASIDPEGNPTTGVTYHKDDVAFNDGRNAAQVTQYAWDNTKYMEVYTVKFVEGDGNSGRSAYAELPNMAHTEANEARVVYNYKYLGFGGVSELDESARFGATFTHEVGHWLSLRHTFLNGCSAPGDYVDDTPFTTGQQGCSGSSCSSKDNGDNYMDYNSGCYAMFSIGQVERMITALNHESRITLWDEAALIETGCKEGIVMPQAKFGAEITSICEGESVTFVNKSRGLPTSYEWTFEGGVPATSTEKLPPVVSYATQGTYKVTLKAVNDNGEDEMMKEEYIRVKKAYSLPLVEDFEGPLFPPAGWARINPDNSYKWGMRDAGHNSVNTMLMANVSNSVKGEKDDIIIAPLDFSSVIDAKLSFYLAYTKYDDESPDQLDVFVSTDCGATWKNMYSKDHQELETFQLDNGPASNSWTPSEEGHWRKEDIDLTEFIGNDYVLIKFQNTSGYGTNIFIDDINVDGSVGVNDKDSGIKLAVYPNPGNGLYSINANFANSDNYSLIVKNILGEEVFSKKIGSFQGDYNGTIDLSAFANGIYVLQVKGLQFEMVKKLIKQ